MQKRLFVGIPVPKSIQTSLQIYTQAIASDTIRFVKPENYHITLTFLGEQEEVKIKQIISVIAGVSSVAKPLLLTFDTISLAPPNKPPSMIWAKYKQNDTLNSMTLQIEKAINSIVSYKDKRGDHVLIPHITLARFKRTSLKDLPQIVLDPIEVTSLALFESKRTDAGQIYTILEEFLLRSECVDIS